MTKSLRDACGTAGLQTRALHGGHQADRAFGALRPPVYATVGYAFESAEQARRLFDGADEGYVYSRIANPTVAALEARMAQLDGGSDAVATASGMAALHLAIVTLCVGGDHIVAAKDLYGGALRLLSQSLPELGINTTFVDTRVASAWEAAIRPETRLLFGASLIYFDLPVLDVPTIARIAHGRGLPLLVDATYTTPALSRPLEQGADLTLHSASKLLNGHGNAMGGLLVEAGRFDWESAHVRHGRTAAFTKAAAELGGRRYLDFAPHSPFCARARRVGLARFGASMAPQTASAILQGLETLPLRIARHVENTRAVVAFLDAHPGVESVHYPELPWHPDHALAARLLPDGCGSVITFSLRGNRDAARRFVDGLDLILQAGTIGDTKSLALAPAVSTHARASDAELAAAGLQAGSVRLSVGLEDAGDLLADLNRGFAAAGL